MVDDSSTIRIAATKVFGDDFDVLLAVDGEDALDVINNDPEIQVVFTDLVMPEMDGFELLNKLRHHKNKNIASLPVIVMTGAENPEIAKQKALDLGATDFISKPFNPTDVRARANSYAKMVSNTKNLRQKTTTDNLTGLLNTKGFMIQVDKEMAFAARHQYDLSAITIEIDNHKDLFISMGRMGTEKLVKRIALILSKGIRKEDSISRVGLAKFCISMPLVNKDNAMEMANKFCQNVEKLNAKLNGKRLKITVSAGVSHIQPNNQNQPKQLIDASLEALKKAASLGQSQIYLINVEDYLQSQHMDLKESSLSIDALLENISQGNEIIVAENLNYALDKLAPLISLLSNEQKLKIFTYR